MTQKPNAAPEELPENYCGNTPLMRQYFATRAENASILLLMRVGDFYEAYGPDAVLIAADLQITLTGREDGGTRVPMAGVPYHAVERYLARLIRAGRRVAIMEQMEDPRYAKGLVKRKVTRIVTPGTVLEDSMLEARSNNYLVAAVVGDPVAGIGVVDVSTGEFLATELTGGERETRLLDEIARLGPAEILVPAETPEAVLDAIRRTSDASLQLTGGDRATAPGNSSRQQLLNHFGTTSLRGFGCEEFTAGLDACALVLRYLRETQAAALAHIRNLGTYSTRDYMVLDGAARRHLEITAPMGDGGRAATLIGVMDETLTPMGGRMLRRWLDEPLLDVAAIRRRHAAVNHLARNELLRTEIRRLLRGVGDLERLMSRTSACLADARDLIALHDGLARLPDIGALLADPIEPLLAAQRELLLRPTEAEALIARAIVESPPAGLREGGIIRPGYDAELDRLRTGGQDARIWIANLETTERQRTGIGSLKVGYNAVFGYYIEVTRANLAKVPAEYIRKQTTAGGERYITPELKEYEAHVLGAEEKSVELEALLFASVRDSVARSSEQVLGLARAVAAVDVTACFAEAAVRRRWVMPEVDESESVDIKAGRHPVIEQLAEQGSFIPNDCLMQPDQRMFIITGPNMSGKSSYLRQTALIVLLAQCGSFVPADSARIGIV
ncbi:MAG: DNA mismatch repair protein MutS, partial [Armatimonadetes bacterium]|nr:DNA mismatch repair protein MutS [Armatimonadota bacterium]